MKCRERLAGALKTYENFMLGWETMRASDTTRAGHGPTNSDNVPVNSLIIVAKGNVQVPSTDKWGTDLYLPRV